MNIIKKNWKILIVSLATVLIGTLGIITALKLYQTRKQPITPTVPKKTPAVSESCVLAFNLTSVSIPSPTPTTTIKPTPTLSLTPTPSRLTPTPTLSLTSTPTPTPTTTIKPTVTLSFPTVTPTKKLTPTPTSQLPVSGISLPIITTVAGGILILILALLIAF